MKKAIAMLLVGAMAMGTLTACGNNNTTTTDNTQTNTSTTTNPEQTTGGDTASSTPAEYVDPYADLADDYDALSEALYYDILGEYYDAYMVAKEATNVSERYALMAIAEAKLMESAVMVPTNTQGGRYAIGRFAPNTSTTTMWGNDYERYHNRILCTEPITTADRDAMKAKWAELKGTGTYEDWAKEYLVGAGYTLKDTYTIGYTSDPKTWDVLATSRAADSEAIINTYDGLVEYDCENVLQPALAESWEVSADGLTWTFNIRKGVKWVDSQGREIGEVTADDFVAGMQHMMDAMGGLEYLVQGIIVNASEYITGDVTDFAEVGVKAVDDYTLTYSLVAPCSYFDTMLGYGVFAPMSREYYESKGGKFGADFDSSAADYTYGVDSDSIAYCGPYLVSNATAENTIVFKANPSYWNADGINVKTLTWLFDDGSDPTKAYNDMVAGVIDGVNLNTSTLELAKADGNFDKYHYVSDTNSTSYMGFYNINRGAYANVNDGAVVSPQTEEDGMRTDAALRNASFRRAVSFAIDRGAYNAQGVGEDLKLLSVRNSYTPGNFVSLAEEVTVDINGTATTYPAGTYYGKIMQDQIDADGVSIKVWDATASAGIGSGDGFDGWYSVENAQAELAVAVEELAAMGIEVSAENPIYIDLPYPSNSETYTNRANAIKQSVEASLGGAVIINTTECVNYDEWYYTGYYTDFGYEANYNLYDLSGWGPDYGDPATYLDTFLPDYAGYMIKCIGIY